MNNDKGEEGPGAKKKSLSPRQIALYELLYQFQKHMFYKKIYFVAHFLHFLFLLDPIFASSSPAGWSPAYTGFITDVVNIIHAEPRVMSRSTFIAIYTSSVIVTAAAIITIALLSSFFTNSNSSVRSKVTFIARLTLGVIFLFHGTMFKALFAPLDCHYTNGFGHTYMPGNCVASLPNGILFFVSLIVTPLLFIAVYIGYFFHAAEPLSLNFQQRTTGRTLMLEFLLAALGSATLTLFRATAFYVGLFSVAYALGNVALLLLNLVLQPFYRHEMNAYKVALNAAAVVASLVAIALFQIPATSPASAPLSVIVLILAPVAACIGFFTSLQLRVKFIASALERFGRGLVEESKVAALVDAERGRSMRYVDYALTTLSQCAATLVPPRPPRGRQSAAASSRYPPAPSRTQPARSDPPVDESPFDASERPVVPAIHRRAMRSGRRGSVLQPMDEDEVAGVAYAGARGLGAERRGGLQAYRRGSLLGGVMSDQLLPMIRRRFVKEISVSFLYSLRAAFVEIETRFLLSPLALDDFNFVMAAEKIFKQGALRFPQSSFLRVALVSFYIHFKRDFAHAKEHIDELVNNVPLDSDVGYAVHCCLKELQLQAALEGDEAGGLLHRDAAKFELLKKLTRVAQFHHNESRRALVRAWVVVAQARKIAESQFELYALQTEVAFTTSARREILRALERVVRAEEAADVAYFELIGAFPKSESVLISYSRYLREVKFDDLSADKVAEFASTVAGKDDFASETASNATKSTSSGTSGDGGGGGVLALLGDVKAVSSAQHSRATAQLRLRMRTLSVLVLVVFAAAFATYVSIVNQFDNRAINIHQSTLRQTCLEAATFAARAMQRAAVDGASASFASFASALRNSSECLLNFNNKLFVTYAATDDVILSWFDNPASVSAHVVDARGAVGGVTLNGNEAVTRFAGLALEVAQAPASKFLSFNPLNLTSFPALAALLLNAPPTSRALDASTALYVQNFVTWTSRLQFANAGLDVFSALIELAIVFLVLRPAVRSVFQNLNSVVEKFARTDASLLAGVANDWRKRKFEGEDAGDGGDAEDAEAQVMEAAVMESAAHSDVQASKIVNPLVELKARLLRQAKRSEPTHATKRAVRFADGDGEASGTALERSVASEARSDPLGGSFGAALENSAAAENAGVVFALLSQKGNHPPAGAASEGGTGGRRGSSLSEGGSILFASNNSSKLFSSIQSEAQSAATTSTAYALYLRLTLALRSRDVILQIYSVAALLVVLVGLSVTAFVLWTNLAALAQSGGDLSAAGRQRVLTQRLRLLSQELLVANRSRLSLSADVFSAAGSVDDVRANLNSTARALLATHYAELFGADFGFDRMLQLKGWPPFSASETSALPVDLSSMRLDYFVDSDERLFIFVERCATAAASWALRHARTRTEGEVAALGTLPCAQFLKGETPMSLGLNRAVEDLAQTAMITASVSADVRESFVVRLLGAMTIDGNTSATSEGGGGVGD